MSDTTTTELPDEVTDYIDELEKANRDLGASLTEALSKVEELTTTSEGDDDDAEEGDDDALSKADPAVLALIAKKDEQMAAISKRADEAEAIAKAERDARLTREFVSKAAEYEPLPTVEAGAFGLFLKSAAEKLDEQEFGVLTEVLDAATEALAKGDLFSEAGSSAGGGVSDIEKSAAALMATDPTMNKFEAIAKAAELDPTLYKKEG